MVCYDSVLCDLCGDEVYNGEFFCEPNSSSHGEELNNYQFLWPPPLVWVGLNEATVDSTLLDTLEDQAADRLLLYGLEGCEDPLRHNTIKEDKKTPPTMLPSTLRIYLYCM